MPLQFPLSLDDFFRGIPVRQATPDLSEGTVMSRTRGGAVLVDDIAERLWQMDVQVSAMSVRAAQALRAKLHILREASASFLVYAKDHPFPAADQGGALISGFAPTLSGIAGNNREVSLAGVPNGYTLTAGDYLSFSYGAAPIYAYHQVVVGGTAAGGTIGALAVTPHVLPGTPTGLAVELVRPAFKAKLVPGSVKPGSSRPRVVDGISFQLIQTLR